MTPPLNTTFATHISSTSSHHEPSTSISRTSYYAPITRLMDENHFHTGEMPPNHPQPPNAPPQDVLPTIKHQPLPPPPSLSQLDKMTDRWRESYLKRKLTEKLLAFQQEEKILIRNGRGRE